MIVNRAQLAELFGISTPKVDRLVKAGCPYVARPENGRGEWGFEPAAVLRWQIAQLISPEDAQAREAKRARARNAVAKADLKEMELRDLRKQLVRIEDVAPIIEAGDAVVIAAALAFAERMGPIVAAEPDASKVQALLKEGVDDCFREIERTLEANFAAERRNLPTE